MRGTPRRRGEGRLGQCRGARPRRAAPRAGKGREEGEGEARETEKERERQREAEDGRGPAATGECGKAAPARPVFIGGGVAC